MTFQDELNYRRDKEKVRILILGPYGSFEERLDSLREQLIEKGFMETKLVKDFPNSEDILDEPETQIFLEKSFHKIREWADVLLFVFTSECNCNSVLRELGYTADNVNPKCYFSSILKTPDFDLGTLYDETIDTFRIREYEWNDIEHLIKKIHSAAFNTFTLWRKINAINR